MNNMISDKTFSLFQRNLFLSEQEAVLNLLYILKPFSTYSSVIHDQAAQLATSVRKDKSLKNGIESFLAEYDLSNQEGIMLMCLAEALLRVPDSFTADSLIKDKLLEGEWDEHLGNSESILVNMSTWALMLTGNVLVEDRRKKVSLLRKMISRTGEPLIRKATIQAMKILGNQFVMGQTIEEALSEGKEWCKAQKSSHHCFSFDMLGEAAVTLQDANKYFEAYKKAIITIGTQESNRQDSISVKLSALHPRYEYHQFPRIKEALYSKILQLAQLAKKYNIQLTIDAEESHRLDISLQLIAQLMADESLHGWEGLGLALQAYQKRAFTVIDWLVNVARQSKKRLNIRLVKGAYWDSEIKIAQQEGLEDYPVFTRKSNTDISYLACAQKILDHSDCFYPQFATHNAHTVCAIMHMTTQKNITDFEFQRLFGMGEILYRKVDALYGKNTPCRIYAPVGGHKDLLAYLVRRLLENGANTSFVQHIANKMIPIADIVSDPIEKTKSFDNYANPAILLPTDIYGSNRKNAYGPCLYDAHTISQIKQSIHTFDFESTSLINGKKVKNSSPIPTYSPSHIKDSLGKSFYASEKDIHTAFKVATEYFPIWEETTISQRSECLKKAANHLEKDFTLWLHLLVIEAGKTYIDAVSEVREAIDFCRYYADIADRTLFIPTAMPGPTGEENFLYMRGKGVFICISPWNFPLAIFIGQVVAALVTGNCVLAKPAEQTPFIAMKAVEMLHKAGVPVQALHLLLGDAKVGSLLISDSQNAGVAFTGSFEVAKIIQQTLSHQPGAIKPLIAETGGINAMLVDSSALPEQVVRDVIISGFRSAGQRCSALRLLILQEDIAQPIIEMIKGAMDVLNIGNPQDFSTDIGPVIDQEAYQNLADYISRNKSRVLYSTPLTSEHYKGHYMAPHLIAINKISDMTQEIFGPFIHICTFKAKNIEGTLEAVNNLGYGLTFGLHSRIQSIAEMVKKKIKAGNIYINRSMIGAVVGTQPFGGEGFSGTGPKAGGPHYLQRFCNERTVSTDTTAAGGNATLLSLDS